MDISCGNTKGVNYGNIWIFKFKDYFSFVLRNYKGEFKEVYKFYYKRESSINIKQVSLTQKDFAHLDLNEYGFKEIAVSGDYSLVVLYSGLLVVYHLGVPSLVGLPSTEPLLSGLYFNKNDSLIYPSMSVFKPNLLMSYLSFYMLSVYRSTDSEEDKLLEVISKISTPQGVKGLEEYTVFSLFDDSNPVTDSDFIKRYPGISTLFLHKVEATRKSEGIKFITE